MKRGYDEVPWDLPDQDFNITCEFSHWIQTGLGENSCIPNELQRTHESQLNVSRRLGETTRSPAPLIQRQEPPLLDFEAEVAVPTVRNLGEPMQQSSTQLSQDGRRIRWMRLDNLLGKIGIN